MEADRAWCLNRQSNGQVKGGSTGSLPGSPFTVSPSAQVRARQAQQQGSFHSCICPCMLHALFSPAQHTLDLLASRLKSIPNDEPP